MGVESSSGKENAAAAAAEFELKLIQKDEEIRNLHAKLKEAQEQKVKVRRLPKVYLHLLHFLSCVKMEKY